MPPTPEWAPSCWPGTPWYGDSLALLLSGSSRTPGLSTMTVMLKHIDPCIICVLKVWSRWIIYTYIPTLPLNSPKHASHSSFPYWTVRHPCKEGAPFETDNSSRLHFRRVQQQGWAMEKENDTGNVKLNSTMGKSIIPMISKCYYFVKL